MDYGNIHNEAAEDILDKAGAYVESGECQKALELYLKLLEVETDDIPLWHIWGQIGYCYKEQEIYKRAIDALEKSVELFDDLTEGINRVATLHDLAYSHWRNDNGDTARDIFEQASKFSLFHVGETWVWDKYLLYLNWGRCERNLENYNSALAVHTKCLELADDKYTPSADRAEYRSLAHAELGETQSCSEIYDKAIQHFNLVNHEFLNKNDLGSFLMNYGNALIGTKDYEGAREKLEQAMESELSEQDQHLATYLLAYCYSRQEKYELSKALFSKLARAENMRPWMAESVAKHISALKYRRWENRFKYELPFVALGALLIAWYYSTDPELGYLLLGACLCVCVTQLYISFDIIYSKFKKNRTSTWSYLTKLQKAIWVLALPEVAISFAYVFNFIDIMIILGCSIVVAIHYLRKRYILE